MIESLLKNSFPIYYGKNPKDVTVPIQRMSTPFSETDNKCCAECHASPKTKNRQCNEENLKVDNSGKEIAVVRFEEYIAQFAGTKAEGTKRCDLLMTESGESHEKIVFCDLHCGNEQYVLPNTGKYPEGKRAIARQQMLRSIEVLIQESVTAVNLLTYPEKVCLFAWRDYDVPDKPVFATRGNATANMLAFNNTASAMTGQVTSHQSIKNHGFTFVQVKYPSVYVW